MLKKMFVGNLPYTTTDEELYATFAPFGDVRSAKVIMDRETGRSRGFGFVEMEANDADAAMQALEGQPQGGRPLRINEARERNDRPFTGGGGFGGGSGGGGGGGFGGGGAGRPDRTPKDYGDAGDRGDRRPSRPTRDRYSRD